MNDLLFEYKGDLYPTYLRDGNSMRFAMPIAEHFCRGRGLDVGCGKWPLPLAIPIDSSLGGDAMNLPEGIFDFIASSHCLEHLADPVAALEHWRSRLRPGGVLMLYLPHPDQKYWRPSNCKKHRHIFWPKDTAEMLRDLGFVDVIHSERDLAWGFSVVGFNGSNSPRCHCGGEAFVDCFSHPRRPEEWFLRCVECGAMSASVATKEEAKGLEIPND